MKIHPTSPVPLKHPKASTARDGKVRDGAIGNRSRCALEGDLDWSRFGLDSTADVVHEKQQRRQISFLG